MNERALVAVRRTWSDVVGPSGGVGTTIKKKKPSLPRDAPAPVGSRSASRALREKKIRRLLFRWVLEHIFILVLLVSILLFCFSSARIAISIFVSFCVSERVRARRLPRAKPALPAFHTIFFSRSSFFLFSLLFLLYHLSVRVAGSGGRPAGQVSVWPWSTENQRRSQSARPPAKPASVEMKNCFVKKWLD